MKYICEVYNEKFDTEFKCVYHKDICKVPFYIYVILGKTDTKLYAVRDSVIKVTINKA